jgi:hypothetical protein
VPCWEIRADRRRQDGFPIVGQCVRRLPAVFAQLRFKAGKGVEPPEGFDDRLYNALKFQ